MKKLAFRFFKIIAVAVFWGMVWFLLSKKIGIELLFPSPASVFSRLWELIRERSFWLTTSVSLLRILWGILIAWILGILLAYLLHVSRILRALLSPMITAIKSTPVASFIILAALWLELNVIPVFITALIVIPIMLANVTEGIHSVNADLIEVANIYRFSVKKRIFHIYIPSIAPYFMAACKSSLGMAWKAGIAAEILSIPEHSIGKELYFSKTNFETPSLFAWTLVVILLSLIIEKLLVYGLERIGNRFRILPQGEYHAEN
jgi:NitT/TauT family transport system permease protein